MSKRSKIDNLRMDSSENLCKFAEILGYRGVADQLQCNNGSYVSSLLAFLDDNPGACQAIIEWWENESGRDSDGEEIDEDEEEEDTDDEEEDEDV